MTITSGVNEDRAHLLRNNSSQQTSSSHNSDFRLCCLYIALNKNAEELATTDKSRDLCDPLPLLHDHAIVIPFSTPVLHPDSPVFNPSSMSLIA
jgi:hypothetical protein